MEEIIKEWLLDPLVGRLIAVAVVTVLIVAVVRFLQRWVSGHIKSADSRYRIRKFFSFIGYLAVFVSITVIFSDKLGGMTVALGVAGAGIAFALQEVIGSVAGWIAVSFGNFYKVGDRVQLGGIMGDVIDIGILRTTIMECGQWVRADLYNGRIVRIANSFVFKEPVFNYSADFPFLWDEIAVPVKYGSDQVLARDILNRIAGEVVGEYSASAKKSWAEMVQKYMIEDARVEPSVFLLLTDNWMEFTLRYMVDFKRRRITKDRLFTLLLEEVEKTGGRVAIASTTLHLVETPVLDVRIREGGEE